MEAEAEMHQGNWSSAINILDRVLRMDRTVYEAVYLKAVCLAALERLNEAIGLASDGARRCPKPQLRQEFGNLVEALQFIVAILPLVKGILAMLAGQHRDALGWFEQALRKDPNDPFVLSHKAICLMYAHRWQEALDTLTKVERQFRDDPIHHYHRCVCYLELGDPSRARNALQEARSRNPAAELRQVLDRMETAIEYAPRRGAIEAMNAERWNDALNQLQGLVRRNGNDAWAHYHIAVCHAKIAEDHLLSRYPNRAAAFQSITSARQAVEQADYYCDRGDTELRGAIDNLRSQLPR
jgi:tetratricopeptide (TPR) repeat protein